MLFARTHARAQLTPRPRPRRRASARSQDVTERGDVGGYPAMPAREWRRREAAMRRLTKRKRATQRAPAAGESAPDE